MKRSTMRGVTRMVPAGTRGIVAIALAVLCAPERAASAQTLGDFGFDSMRRDGVAASGTHPLLLAVAEYAVPDTLDEEPSYYHDLFFSLDPTGLPDGLSVNGYVDENSNGRFLWSSAAGGPVVVQMPIEMTLDSLQVFYQDDEDVHRFEREWFTAVIEKIAVDGLFDFQPYDTDGSGTVTYDELGVFILSNDPGSPGLARATYPANGPNVDVRMDATAAAMERNGDLDMNVLIHESLHILRTIDIYGESNLSADLSLMAGRTGTSSTAMYHLDPWHKMALGWVEPRIRSLAQSGSAVVPTPQSGDVDAPILLYDPTEGTDEFFLLEYRSNEGPNASVFEDDVAGDGLVIWQVWQRADFLPEAMPCVGDTTENCYAVATRGAPDLMWGGRSLWRAGTTSERTPLLEWIDPAKPDSLWNTVSVSSFMAGDATIVVAWESWVWVDFSYAGPESGTFEEPFDTLAEGLGAGPRVVMKAGTTPEVGTITTPALLDAFGGSAIIGE